jgi:putative DNA primase/helicase
MALARHAQKSEASSRINALIEVARTEPGIPIMPDQLDTDPYLLNVMNGTLDLRTGELRPHRREDLITKLAPVEFDSRAQSQTFMKFLSRITDGDEELQGFIQRAIGYGLTGDTSEQVLFISHGTGANGKTTLLNQIQDMLGDYSQQSPTETLVRKRERSATNDIARLQGARFVVASEVAEGGKLDEVLVKQLTGLDTISAKFHYQEYFDFRPQCKFFLVTNHKPEIRGSDEGIWRRIMLIPFEVRIPEGDRDKHLPEKLRQELPGILAWAVRGCLDWQKDGLAPPEKVRAATADYRAEMDWMSAFLSECCILEEGAKTTAKDLYGALTKWCFGDDDGPPSQKEFGRRLRIAGLRREKKSGIYWWFGIALK